MDFDHEYRMMGRVLSSLEGAREELDLLSSAMHCYTSWKRPHVRRVTDMQQVLRALIVQAEAAIKEPETGTSCEVDDDDDDNDDDDQADAVVDDMPY